MVGENMNRLKLRCRDYFGRGDIDEVISRNDIVNVISGYVSQKKRKDI